MADSRIDIVVTSKVRDAISGLGRVASSIGKIGLAGAGIAGTGLVALTAASIKAAASYETLELRLEAVTGSAQKAKRIFGELRTFAASTPLQLGDLTEARILLEGIGVTGQKALEKAASAAAALNKPIIEVASAVASIETEPLRRMGIEVRRVGDEATFSFRDKFGRSIKTVSKGIDETRRRLLDIFNVKFGGFLGKASQSFNGLVSTLRDGLKEAAAQLGSEMLPVASRFVSDLNAGISDLVKSGKLKEIGGNIGSALAALFTETGRREFVNYMRDVFDTAINRLAEVFSRFGEDIIRYGKILGLEIQKSLTPSKRLQAVLSEAQDVYAQRPVRIPLSTMFPFPSANPLRVAGANAMSAGAAFPMNASVFSHRGFINGQNLGYERTGSTMVPSTFFDQGSARFSRDGRKVITAGDVGIKEAIEQMHDTLRGYTRKYQPIPLAQ